MNVKDNDDFEVVPRCSGVFYTYLLPSYSYVLRIQYNVTSTGQSVKKSAISPTTLSKSIDILPFKREISRSHREISRFSENRRRPV